MCRGIERGFVGGRDVSGGLGKHLFLRWERSGRGIGGCEDGIGKVNGW